MNAFYLYDTTNTFKNGLDNFWSNQEVEEVLYDYKADLHGIENRSTIM